MHVLQGTKNIQYKDLDWQPPWITVCLKLGIFLRQD